MKAKCFSAICAASRISFWRCPRLNCRTRLPVHSHTCSRCSLSCAPSLRALQPFDCCHLSCQPAKIPVITPNGYLYDKANIIENLLHQKQENARKMKEYEVQRKKHEALQAEEQARAAPVHTAIARARACV